MAHTYSCQSFASRHFQILDQKKVAPCCVNLSVSEADCLLDVWLFFSIRSFTQAESLCNILCIAVPCSECLGLNATLAGKLMRPFSALFYFN